MEKNNKEKYVITCWKKYKSIDGLPRNISVEIEDESANQPVEFNVDKFAELYYLPKSKVNDSFELLKGLDRTCKWVEESIYKDCKKETWTCKDVFRILAWKAGKINHKESLKYENNIVYYDNWNEGKDNNSIIKLQMPHQRVIGLEEFKPVAEEIIKIRKQYCSNKNINQVWDSLIKLVNGERTSDSMRGIGTVYLITLLHFITEGECPIYDRFAMASLVSLKLRDLSVSMPIDSIVRGCGLPDKSNERKLKYMLDKDSEYGKYCKLLEEFFPKGKWKNRKVDQALWVYGHLFRVE